MKTTKTAFASGRIDKRTNTKTITLHTYTNDPCPGCGQSPRFCCCPDVNFGDARPEVK